MTDEEQAKQDRQMADLMAWAERSNVIAKQLMEADPGLPYMTATIIANDIQSADLRTQEVESGKREAKDVVWLIGSYARWDWAVTMVKAGKLPGDWFAENIAGLWTGSDPNDTDKGNLAVWRSAFAQRGGYIRDGRPLPKGKGGRITIYRGGHPDNVGYGFAWTTDPKIAKKFARTHGTRQSMPGGVVIAGQVRPLNCLAYLTGRHESEVIVDPRYIENMHQIGGFG